MELEELNINWKELVSKMDKLQLERYNIEKAIGDLGTEISTLRFKAWENGFIRDQTLDNWIKKESMAERMKRLNNNE